MDGKNIVKIVVAIMLFLAITLMGYYYWQGSNTSIDWKVTAQSEASEFEAYGFQKGPFSFSIPGTYYTLTESFSAGPIERFFTRDGLLLALCWLGVCIILAVASLLSPLWFSGIAGLFIFLIIRLQLPEVGIFGFSPSSHWGNVLIMALFITPAYIFHAFWKNTVLWLRIVTLSAISAIIFFVGGVDLFVFQEQFNIGIYYGIIVLMLLFLFFIAEENIFAILFLVTKTKGGENNEKHFSVFSLVYLFFIGLVYSKKAGFIKLELPFFDPYVLLIISTIITLWSLWHKRNLYENILSYSQALILFMGIGLSVFGYLTLAMSRGNDAVYEGLHYFIIYSHMAFGLFFFLYVIVNFVDPLQSGLQVYKIAYKPQSFPYVSARIAGIVAVVAFFLLADKQAFKLFKAGHFNYLGEQAELQNERGLANQYYLQGNIYGHDNHFSNYKLAYDYLKNNKISQANHKFGRATLRYPSAQSFVNRSSTASMLSNVTPSLVALQEGLKRFPNEKPILNNLGLIYMDLGQYDQAAQYFEQARETGKWSNANLVNLWKIGRGEDEKSDFASGNLAVKSNILASLLADQEKSELAFDKEDLDKAPWLHKQIYLVNSTWYFGGGITDSLLTIMTERPLDEGIYDASLQALAISKYQNGEVNEAIRKLDQLYHLSSANDRAKYLNQIGLICMDRHALPLAHAFFDRALAAGYSEAKLNKGVAYLESGKFDLGLKWFRAMAAEDSVYLPLAIDFEEVLNGMAPTQDQLLVKVYYNYEDFSLSEMKAFIDRQDPLYVLTLWNKISRELLLLEDMNILEDYLSIFKPLLLPEDYSDVLAIVALKRNLTFAGEHPVAKALEIKSDSAQVTQLVILASKDALNSPFVLSVAERALKVNPSLAYDLLVEAIEINDQNPQLLKAYIMAALEIRLTDYAMFSLEKLKLQISQSSYSTFMEMYKKREKELESNKW